MQLCYETEINTEKVNLLLQLYFNSSKKILEYLAPDSIYQLRMGEILLIFK
jgi:hypothetical protein